MTVSAGGISSCFITNGGTGYAVGDELGITTLGSTTLGRNARFSVGIISAINALVLDGVQGEFVTGTAGTMTYVVQETGAVGILTGVKLILHLMILTLMVCILNIDIEIMQ